MEKRTSPAKAGTPMTERSRTGKRFLMLHDLPQRTENGVRIDADGLDIDGSTYITFHHIDGFYSYCRTEKGNIIHLSAMTPIEATVDGYKFVTDKKE